MNRVVLAILGVMAALVVAVGVLVMFLVLSGDSGGAERQAGELRLLGPEPITLDPHVAQDASSAVYVVELFGGLLTLDPQLQIQPDLATEIPTTGNGGKVVNADNTVTYTFQVRDDALFHDRKPVTAETVKCSIERAADPATESLVSEFFLGDILGVKDKLDGTAEEVSGVTVVDDRTVAITIDRDMPSFLYKLTYPTAFVVDMTQTGGTCGSEDFGDGDPNWTRNPNGTGPYEMAQWRFGERIVLEANDHYHLGVPNVQTVRYLLAGSGITLYERDEVDVTGVPATELQRVQDPTDSLNADYQSGDRLLIDYLGFNTNAPPFDDVNVRKAFAMAIDKETISSAVLENAVPIADSIIMPGLAAHNPNARLPQFDPAVARQALADSRYGGPEDLPEVTFVESGTGATAGEGTQAIIEMWRDNLGVEVQVQQAEPATFFQDVSDGRYQIFGLAWIMDYPSEDDLLNIHFDSESPNNDTFYSNPQVDQLLRQALTEPDAQQRIQLYQQAEQIILDEVPWVPLFFDRYHVLIKPYVHDYLIPPAVVPRLRFITLDPPPS